MTPHFLDVPMGTPAKTCRFCPATIYFTITPGGKKMPVNCDVDGGVRPTDSSSGAGIPHFADCPGADKARRPR